MIEDPAYPDIRRSRILRCEFILCGRGGPARRLRGFLRQPVPEVLERLRELAAGAPGRFQELAAMLPGERGHLPSHAAAQPFVEALHRNTEATSPCRELPLQAIEKPLAYRLFVPPEEFFEGGAGARGGMPRDEPQRQARIVQRLLLPDNPLAQLLTLGIGRLGRLQCDVEIAAALGQQRLGLGP